jgi:phospholipid-transporting ATPase
MDVVKFQLAQLINTDLDMYYARTDTPAVCRTSSLVEELGQIEYIFSDKTGTLTCNEMEFRECSIFGTMYAQTVDENKAEQGQKTFQELERRQMEPGEEGDTIREFLTLLAVCHTVIPEIKDEKIIYQASSPDEAALVSGAEELGYRFHVSMHLSEILSIRSRQSTCRLANRNQSLSRLVASRQSSRF